MGDGRSQRLTIIIGGQKTGKSTFADEGIKRYDNSKTGLIVEADGEEKIWWKYPLVKVSEISKLKKTSRVIFDLNDRTFIQSVYDNTRNGFIVFDDPKSFIRPWNYYTFEAIVIRRRAKNNDVTFIYHSFKKVPGFVWDYATHVVLFRLDGGFSIDKSLLQEGEYELWDKRIKQINKLAKTDPHVYRIYERIKMTA